MSNKPTHKAYIVIPAKEGSNAKNQWLEVGAVWPHKQGTGFDLILPEGLAVSGCIVCMPPKSDDKHNA